MYGCSLRRRQAFYGKRHPETARGQYKLGIVALELGDYEGAKTLLDDAESTSREAQLTGTPDFGRILCAQGQICAETGQFVKTDQYIRPLFSTDARLYLQDTKRIINALTAYAIAYVAVDAPEHSLTYLNSTIEILDKQSGQVLRGASERQRNAYLAACHDQLSIYASVVVRYHAQSPDAVRALFELVQRYKAMSLEAAILHRRAALAPGDRALADALKELSALRREVAAAELRRSRTGKSSDSLRLLQLVRKRGRLEKVLTSLSPSEPATDNVPRFTLDVIFPPRFLKIIHSSNTCSMTSTTSGPFPQDMSRDGRSHAIWRLR